MKEDYSKLFRVTLFKYSPNGEVIKKDMAGIMSGLRDARKCAKVAAEDEGNISVVTSEFESATLRMHEIDHVLISPYNLS